MAAQNPTIVQNFIGGEFHSCSRTLDSLNPADGTVSAVVPNSDQQDVDRAVTAAVDAFPGWKALGCEKRASYLRRLADLLESRLEEFAAAESRDQGKPVWLARTVDIPRAVHNFRHFANAVPHLMGTSKVHPDLGVVNYTTREAVGVAGLISPWNLPLYLLTFKLAPALVCGNTVVAKPSELTSVTAHMLCELIKEVQFPPGVLNMVYGLGGEAGASLVQDPRVRIVSFTGSTATGAMIAAVAAPLFKKLSLEMGGKNAAIVYGDANLQKTVQTLVRSSFINQGQVCLCTSRIYVHQTIYESFIEKFVAAAKALKTGDPSSSSVFLGALNSRPHLEKVEQCVRAAVAEGGVVRCGYTKDDLQTVAGSSPDGCFMAPTILTDVQDTFHCMQEEIFGPVTCVASFATDEEVILRANGVRYGLCAAVFTEDLSRAHSTAQRLDVGTVWTNCWLVRDLDLPFGGVKDSGMGREGSLESWDFYTEQKTVCIKI